MASDLDRWRQDPCAFIREILFNPETGAAFELYPAEERFLSRGSDARCRWTAARADPFVPEEVLTLRIWAAQHDKDMKY